MTATLEISRIASWHAHVYFDAASRDAALDFRDVLTMQFGNRIQMGRFHEREVAASALELRLHLAPLIFPIS